MFFEPTQFPDWLNIPNPLGGYFMNVRPVGFEKPPGAEIGSANHVLNDHTYCCQLGLGVCDSTGEPSADSAEMCAKWHKYRIGKRHDDAQRLGLPFMLSEFGACLNSTECAREITQIADVIDENVNTGWAYW